ncbi:TPA: sigma-70 family RNA polymerase sigma factor [Enterococcus faecium]
MKTREERYNAQLTKYFEKVIVNRSNNFYAKKFRQNNFEDYIEDSSISFIDPKTINGEFDVPNVVVFNVSFYIENEVLEMAFSQMNEREKFFIINKFIFGSTDKEIGQLLGISRQAVNNFKQRLYRRIKNLKKR